MAETELGNYDEAIESFTQAMEIGTETNKKNAEAWIDYVADEGAARSLKRFGAEVWFSKIA